MELPGPFRPNTSIIMKSIEVLTIIPKRKHIRGGETNGVEIPPFDFRSFVSRTYSIRSNGGTALIPIEALILSPDLMQVDTNITFQKKSTSFTSVSRFPTGRNIAVSQTKQNPEVFTSKFFMKPGNLPSHSITRTTSESSPMTNSSLFSSSSITVADDKRRKTLKSILTPLHKDFDTPLPNQSIFGNSSFENRRDYIAQEFASRQSPSTMIIEDGISQSCMSSLDPKMFQALTTDKNTLGWLPVVFSLNRIISLYAYVNHFHHDRAVGAYEPESEIDYNCCIKHIIRMMAQKHMKPIRAGLRCFTCTRLQTRGTNTTDEAQQGGVFPLSDLSGELEEEELFLVTRKFLDYFIAEMDTKISISEQKTCLSGLSIQDCVDFISSSFMESGGIRREFGVWLGDISYDTGKDFTSGIQVFRTSLLSHLSQKTDSSSSKKKTPGTPKKKQKITETQTPSPKPQQTIYHQPQSTKSTPNSPLFFDSPLLTPPSFFLDNEEIEEEELTEHDITCYLSPEYQRVERGREKTILREYVEEAIESNEKITESIPFSCLPLPQSPTLNGVLQQNGHNGKRKRSYDDQIKESELKFKQTIELIRQQHEDQLRLLRLLAELERETRDFDVFKPPFPKRKR